MTKLGNGFTMRFGRAIYKEMPALLAAGEKPISMDHVLEQQYTYPKTWGRTRIFTGDVALKGAAGDVVIELDSLLLQSVGQQVWTLSGDAVLLSEDQWEESRGNLGNLHLSPDKVEEAHNKGYVKKNGVWQPENRAVAEVWYHLGRGKDLRSYAQLSSEESNNSPRVMRLKFNTEKQSKPIMQPWCVDFLSNELNAYGSIGACAWVGVAPEVLAARRAGQRDPAYLSPTLREGFYVAPGNLDEVPLYSPGEAVRFARRQR